MQKIWICGCDGQIGKAINHVVNKLEFEILDTDKEIWMLQIRRSITFWRRKSVRT